MCMSVLGMLLKFLPLLSTQTLNFPVFFFFFLQLFFSYFYKDSESYYAILQLAHFIDGLLFLS